MNSLEMRNTNPTLPFGRIPYPGLFNVELGFCRKNWKCRVSQLHLDDKWDRVNQIKNSLYGLYVGH